MQFQKYLIYYQRKFLKNRIQVNFVIAHISNEEILDIINALENKSTGPSSIPLKTIIINTRFNYHSTGLYY